MKTWNPLPRRLTAFFHPVRGTRRTPDARAPRRGGCGSHGARRCLLKQRPQLGETRTAGRKPRRLPPPPSGTHLHSHLRQQQHPERRAAGHPQGRTAPRVPRPPPALRPRGENAPLHSGALEVPGAAGWPPARRLQVGTETWAGRRARASPQRLHRPRARGYHCGSARRGGRSGSRGGGGGGGTPARTVGERHRRRGAQGRRRGPARGGEEGAGGSRRSWRGRRGGEPEEEGRRGDRGEGKRPEKEDGGVEQKGGGLGRIPALALGSARASPTSWWARDWSGGPEVWGVNSLSRPPGALRTCCPTAPRRELLGPHPQGQTCAASGEDTCRGAECCWAAAGPALRWPSRRVREIECGSDAQSFGVSRGPAYTQKCVALSSGSDGRPGSLRSKVYLLGSPGISRRSWS